MIIFFFLWFCSATRLQQQLLLLMMLPPPPLPPTQLDREHQVGELRLGVLLEERVSPILAIQIRQVDPRLRRFAAVATGTAATTPPGVQVQRRRHRDDPRWTSPLRRRLSQFRKEEVREEEVTEVIRGHRDLDPVLRRDFPPPPHDARVVDQNVQRRTRGQEGPRRLPHGRERR